MSEKRIAVVVNPIAGGGRGRKVWKIMRPGLKALFAEIDCRISNHVDELARISQSLLATEPDFLLVIGGDGTLSQAINGYMHNDRSRSPKTRLAYFNAGCGGDFARQFPRQHITEFLDRLIHDQYYLTNIGKIICAHDPVHYFINISSCGISSQIVERMTRGRWLKKLGGTINYLVHSLLGLLTYQPVPVTIEIDDEEAFETNLMLTAVCNGRYFAGNMKVAPMALIDDDLLDVVMFLNFTRFEALRKIPKLYGGRHFLEKKVYYRQAKKIRITNKNNTKLAIEADGEKAGMLPAEFSLLPDKLPIIV